MGLDPRGYPYATGTEFPLLDFLGQFGRHFGPAAPLYAESKVSYEVWTWLKSTLAEPPSPASVDGIALDEPLQRDANCKCNAGIPTVV